METKQGVLFVLSCAVLLWAGPAQACPPTPDTGLRHVVPVDGDFVLDGEFTFEDDQDRTSSKTVVFETTETAEPPVDPDPVRNLSWQRWDREPKRVALFNGPCNPRANNRWIDSLNLKTTCVSMSPFGRHST